MIFKTKLHYIGTSIERLGQVAGAAGPDIRQTRKCVCYYTQVACDTIIGCVRSNTQIACAAILVFVTLERALVYCNFHKRGQVRWLGPEGPDIRSGRQSVCATIPLGSESIYLGLKTIYFVGVGVWAVGGPTL